MVGDGSSSNALWGLSFASYSLPKLLEQSCYQLLKVGETLLQIREEAICMEGDEIFLLVGLWLEGSELSNIRRRFVAKAIDLETRRFKFKEWSHESFTCTIILMPSSKHIILWGNNAARLLAWCPRVIEVDFDKDAGTIAMRSLRRRDIYKFCESCDMYNEAQFSRPLLRGHVNPRSVSLSESGF